MAFWRQHKEWNRRNVGSCFVLAIKHEFVAFSDDKLDRKFCKVDQGQWKPGNTSLFIAMLCSWNHWCLYSLLCGSSQGRVLRSLPDLFIHYCFIRRARVLLFCMLSQSLFLRSLPDSFGFPYANHIHCIFALWQVCNECDLLCIPLVGRVLRDIITWWHLWKYGFPWYK